MDGDLVINSFTILLQLRSYTACEEKQSIGAKSNELRLMNDVVLFCLGWFYFAFGPNSGDFWILYWKPSSFILKSQLGRRICILKQDLPCVVPGSIPCLRRSFFPPLEIVKIVPFIFFSHSLAIKSRHWNGEVTILIQCHILSIETSVFFFSRLWILFSYWFLSLCMTASFIQFLSAVRCPSGS